MRLKPLFKGIVQAIPFVPGVAALTGAFVPPGGELLYGLLGEVAAAAGLLLGLIVAPKVISTRTSWKVAAVILLIGLAFGSTWWYADNFTSVVHSIPVGSEQNRDLLIPLPVAEWQDDASPQFVHEVLCEKERERDLIFDCGAAPLDDSITVPDIVRYATALGPSEAAAGIPDTAEDSQRASLLPGFLLAIFALALAFTIGTRAAGENDGGGQNTARNDAGGAGQAQPDAEAGKATAGADAPAAGPARTGPRRAPQRSVDD